MKPEFGKENAAAACVKPVWTQVTPSTNAIENTAFMIVTKN
jgi:hypothetical protein